MLVEAFDEAASGLPTVAFPALTDEYRAGATALSAAVFVAPYLAALFLDGPLLLWAERFERRRMLCLGVLGMALSILGAAAAPNLLLFAVAFVLFSPASGLACGIAQALLVDAAPSLRERAMTDWAIAGWLGDLLGPALFWVAAELGLGFRTVFCFVALLGLIPALFGLVRPAGGAGGPLEDDEDEALPLLDTLRLLAKNRELWWWLLGVSLCALLDEIVVGLVGLRLHEQGAGPALLGPCLLAFTTGGLAGLAVLRWGLARCSGRRLLGASCAVTILGFSAWLWLPPTLGSVACLFLVGASVAPHYPLAQANAYAALPERSTLVAAAAQPFTLVELTLPLALGFVAEHLGLTVGLALLLLQPLGLLGVLALTRNFTLRSGP